ncbi:Bax inhibitor-1/YccA family protein [Ahrensia sp. R2A130]|uniref:Bax inhibitor-1/YccA family protein n=1 Tax=Ahrensia sp. R2A130 TaxID=744979 RepID=UPI0001E09C3A|nr:Bax inhibitor-1/YccA family protein [Ahrensia sp. R2A130]EFL89612.1 inner membrane protein YbhL [Ahrensia sp. R2A130]
MADYREEYRTRTMPGAAPAAGTDVQYDEGLRSYMLGIYNYMATALAVTGLSAIGLATWAQSNPAVANAVYNSPLKWVLMLAPLAFVLVISFGINKLSKTAAMGVFYAFAAVMGASISWIFMVYSLGSITQTFFVTSAAFAGLSLYGYTTKRVLSGMGSFLMMGLIGLILAMVVNIFLQSSALGFAISAIGVLIFAGLTAYDTQRLKHMYDSVAHNGEMMAKASIMGALSLYLNFVNMFMFLLSFMGNRE